MSPSGGRLSGKKDSHSRHRPFNRKMIWRMLEEAGATEPPIDVDAVAKYCGCRVVAEKLPRPVLGIYRKQPNRGGIICINPDPWWRGTTIAHELGHHLCGTGEARLWTANHGADFHIQGDLISEWLACAFANELTMPIRLFDQQWKAGPPQALDAAQYFGVPFIAAQHRLIALGYVPVPSILPYPREWFLGLDPYIPFWQWQDLFKAYEKNPPPRIN